MRNPSKNTLKRIVKILKNTPVHNTPDWVLVKLPHVSRIVGYPVKFKFIKIKKKSRSWSLYQ